MQNCVHEIFISQFAKHLSEKKERIFFLFYYLFLHVYKAQSIIFETNFEELLILNFSRNPSLVDVNAFSTLSTLVSQTNYTIGIGCYKTISKSKLKPAGEYNDINHHISQQTSSKFIVKALDSLNNMLQRWGTIPRNPR